MNLQQMTIEALEPNDYNPNQMTSEEFAELVAEVKHLGRLPKPVIVRPNGAPDRFVIVDGEHGWRAAQEAGLAEVPVEVVEVDDFEARRQTYKRNQHGTHNPVKLGQMFRQMMTDRKLSQRALAAAMEVSEGTIRNALIYADATEGRPDYAFEKLTVRQTRAYLKLPRSIGNLWLECGADLKALYGMKKQEDFERCCNGKDLPSDAYFPDYNYKHIDAADLLQHLKPYAHYPYQDFVGAVKKLEDWLRFEESWCRGGLTREQVRPYTEHYFKGEWVVRDPAMISTTLNLIIDTSAKPPRFRLSPEELSAIIAEGHHDGDSADWFFQRVRLAVTEKTGEKFPTTQSDTRRALLAIELQDAPDYLRDSTVPADVRHAIWKASVPTGKVTIDGPLPTMSEETVEPFKRQLLAEIEADPRHRLRFFRDDSLRKEIGQQLKQLAEEKQRLEEWNTWSEDKLAWALAYSVPFYADLDVRHAPPEHRRAQQRLHDAFSACTKQELLWLYKFLRRQREWKQFVNEFSAFAAVATGQSPPTISYPDDLPRIHYGPAPAEPVAEPKAETDA